MSVADNIKVITASLPAQVQLVAVSKFQAEDLISEAYQAGQRIFGESRAQELKLKHDHLPKDIQWHFIGTLQTNKIKYIIDYVSLIHSVDSLKLLMEINKLALKASRVVDCLLQLHVAEEDTKFGFTPDECRAMLEQGEWKSLSHVRICGVMAMASNTDDDEQIRREFCLINTFFQEIKSTYFVGEPSFKEISMGMSHDYSIAIEEGSTLVRIGSSIFGERITH